MAARAPLPVHAWPAGAEQALGELRSDRALTVISVRTPETELRRTARRTIRNALQEVLGALLQRPIGSILFTSLPGQAIALDLPNPHISLSVSHAAGLSVAAIRVGAAIGIDLMRIEPGAAELPDWARIAQDYLGPQVNAGLATLAPALRAVSFAHAWTRHEAGLKCLGLPLTEWTPALAHRLAPCVVTALALPAPYCGALAAS